MNTVEKKINSLTVCSFILSFLIVWVHNGPVYSENSVNTSLFSKSLILFDGRIHQILTFVVPTYFLISGYLFFRNYKKELWLEKIKRRALSIGIPFIFWNTCFYFLEYVAYSLGVPNADKPICDIKHFVISVISSQYTDLWFLRYLFVCVLLSPLLYFAIKEMKFAVLTVVILIIIKMVFESTIPIFPSYYLPIYTVGGGNRDTL